MRAARNALSVQERHLSAERCARMLCNHPRFRNAQRIAVYLSADGELDTQALIARGWEMGKQLYLPVLLPQGENRLWFARYAPDTALQPNRFNILEPAHPTRTRVAPLGLDLVLTPLVAFDTHGHRLGMGGGFYDRSFAYLLRHRTWLRPRLIGLAYDFQKQSSLSSQRWDVPLHAVATDHQLYIFR